MIRCKTCGGVFSQPREEWSSFLDGGGRRVRERAFCCPLCGEQTLEMAVPCPLCGDWMGGGDVLCPHCRQDLRFRFCGFLDELTPPEREVLDQLVEGRSLSDDFLGEENVTWSGV